MSERRIEKLKPITPETDPMFFREFHALTVRHGMAGEWRVTRQHDHFPMLEGEVLVEVTDERSRTHTLRPVMVPAPDTIPAGWNINAHGEACVYAHCTPRRIWIWEPLLFLVAIPGSLLAACVYLIFHIIKTA